MAKQNKMVLPILLGGGLLAVLMMGGKKAKAAGAPTGTGTGEMPGDGGIEPIPAPVPMPPAPAPGWKTEVDPGAITEMEKNAAELAVKGAGTTLDSSYYPVPYNQKKANQSMLDWKTNVAYWTVYSTTKSPWVTFDKSAFSEPIFQGIQPSEGRVPYKITQKMPDADKWAAIWIRIRNWIKAKYPDINTNPIYAEKIKSKEITDQWPYF